MSAEKVSSRMKLFGVLTIIFGILAIASPWVAGQSILWLVGVLVMAGGLTRMFWAFKAGSLGKGILVFLIGVLTLLAGLAIIAHPIMSAGVLTIVLAIYFFVDGFSELMAAFALPGGVDGKGWLIFDGLVTIALGVLIFTGFPFAGTVAIGVFLGIKLLFIGISMMLLGSAARAVPSGFRRESCISPTSRLGRSGATVSRHEAHDLLLSRQKRAPCIIDQRFPRQSRSTNRSMATG